MIGNLPEDNEELTATSLTFTLKMILSYKNMLLNINSYYSEAESNLSSQTQ